MAFRPVFKVGDHGRWVKMSEPADILLSADKEIEAQFNFDFSFDNKTIPVYFAMTYPYGYSDLQNDLDRLETASNFMPSIYFKRELLVRSYEGRRVDLLTISSHSNDSGKPEDKIHPELFPADESAEAGLSKRFENGKLIIFLTARVHPGETPASFSIKGTIEFLMDETDPQAKALREMFVFKIIPMINPDGVYRGHFRTDGFGRNLNRYYKDATLEQQPSVFAIVQLINYFEKDKRIFFFCDYHAHGSCKNHFFYGNSLGFVSEVEARTFARILELNNSHFKYSCCDFSPKQMDAKESNPLEKNKRTKEQCSRVATYRYAQLIHSFTLELGYHEPKRIVKTEAETPFSVESFMLVGKDLMVSLLDLFERNPRSKLPFSLEAIRKEVADQIKDTFKKREGKIAQKVVKVHEMIEESYYQPIKKRRDEASVLKTNCKSVNVYYKNDEYIVKCPSQEKPRPRKEIIRSRLALDQVSQLNTSLAGQLPTPVNDTMDGNASTPLKISVSLLKENAKESKHRIHVLTRIPNLHSRIPTELKRVSYLPDLTINRKISSTKILEPDEIFGLNNVTGGIRHSIKPIKKKEPLRIMSNKTFEEMKSPANAQTLAPVVTNDRKDDAPLFPTYFNGRLRYPRDEGIVIAKSVNGPKIGYRANLRIMKLKAVQERLMAEKGIRGFFNIKTTSKDNSRENSVNLELSITAKKKDNILDEALNELKDSMTIVESSFLGNSRS